MADDRVLTVRVTVNGQDHELAIEPNLTLAELVRGRLGLTGTKVSCGLEICGACAVLVDGRAVSSCTMLAADVDGASVRTVEGLAEGGALDRLQEAFVRHGALQCGYCTPGFLMAATELLEAVADPDEATIVRALGGNICRCTGYRPIIEAIRDAARGHGDRAAAAATGGEPAARGDRRVIGRPIPRIDAAAKVTGAAAFVGDLAVPGTLHAVVVRSEIVHGRIVALEREAAAAAPDVVRVLTFADLAAGLASTHYGPVVRDCPLLADGVVRYEGEPVAVVVARTLEAAQRAARLVEVTYEELAPVVDLQAAMGEGSPRLHETATPGEFGGPWADGWQPERNVAGQYHDRRGDVEAALAAADRVFEHEYAVPTIHHYAIENQVALAVPGPGAITVHGANQYPFLMARLIGDLLGLPLSSVRVSVPYVGGAFGGKEYASVLPLAAAAAWLVGRPVRLEYTHEESFRTVVRHAARMRFTSGVSADGRILARRVELLFDTGAYADQGPRVIRQAGYRAPGPYRIPNLAVDAYAVYTTKVPAGAYRGFGASQPIFACESHMDEIALGLGLDPVEFRRRNLLGLGDDFAAGDLPLDCDLPEALRLAVAEMSRPSRVPVADGRARGVGYAVGVKNTASGSLPSTAIVRIHADGSASVLASGVEMGQGSFTMLAMVAAETLGLPVDRVRVSSPDTAVTPFDQRTSSSRSTVHLGLAVQRAAADAVSPYPGRRGAHPRRIGGAAGPGRRHRHRRPAAPCDRGAHQEPLPPGSAVRSSASAMSCRSTPTRRPPSARAPATGKAPWRRPRWRSTGRPARSRSSAT